MDSGLNQVSKGDMSGIDWIVIGVYFVLLAGVVIGSSRQQQTSADYFLAGRQRWMVCHWAQLFASNIGSEHIVGLADQEP